MININLILESLPLLAHGAMITIILAAAGALIGIVLGTLLGLAQRSSVSILKWLSTFYVVIIRGTPLLIQILIVAYVLPQLGLSIPMFWAAILAIGLNSAAYVSQVIKSGIAAVGKGQIEAAQTLGLRKSQIIRFIILPQAFRAIIPSLGNELITLVKETSLASVIGVYELTKSGNIIRNRTYDALTVFTAVALFYLLLTGILSLIVLFIERKMAHHAKH